MATYYVWSGSGGEASPYNSWGTAAHSIISANALTSATAGDTVYVAHDHSETTATAGMSPAAGSNASPTKVVCGTRTGTTSGDTGISGLATTAAITNSTTAPGYGGTNIYTYGIIFAQSSNSSTTFTLGGSATSGGMFESCQFLLNGTSNTTRLAMGQTSTSYQPKLQFKNCSFKFGSTLQSISVDCNVEITGGTWLSGGSNTTAGLFKVSNSSRGCSLDIRGFDFSNCASGVELFAEVGNAPVLRLRNCKMPASWVATSMFDGGGAPTGSVRGEMFNYSVGAGDTNYRFHTADLQGTCDEDITVYRDAGASDEATPYSIKMVSSANVSWPSIALRSPPIIQRVNPAGGGTKTVSVHIVCDNAVHLDNKDVWLEIEYLGNSGSAQSSFYTNAPAFNVAASTYGASGEAWTGTGGFSNARAELLTSSSLTFAEAGYCIATVCYGGGGAGGVSKTIYVDPKLIIA